MFSFHVTCFTCVQLHKNLKLLIVALFCCTHVNFHEEVVSLAYDLSFERRKFVWKRMF